MDSNTEGTICKHLRSKQYYVANQEHSSGMSGGAAAHCWCLRTMKVMGPDSRVASASSCTGERECWEPDGF